MSEVTLDWDIKYEDVRGSVSWGVLRRFVLANRSACGPVFCRRSSSGNSHVKFEVNDARLRHTFYEILELRAFLRDDPYRIKLDLIRHLVEKNIHDLDLSQWKPGGAGGTDRLWDWKVKGGVAFDAGPWQQICLKCFNMIPCQCKSVGEEVVF